LPVSFAPTNSGAFSNAVVFASNGGNSTNPVAGQGIDWPVLLSPTISEGSLLFSFNSVTGKTYTLQYKDLLYDPVWLSLQTITGDGTLKIITNGSAVPAQRFYRLRAQ